LFERFSGLEVPNCPFVNLLEAKRGRWGEGLTKEKMNEFRCLKSLLVGQFEFTEWTPEGHLRHSRFMRLREDKKASLERCREPHFAQILLQKALAIPAPLQ
jgi:ATP-dependent DNA ligase